MTRDLFAIAKFLLPELCGACWNIVITFGMEKLEWCGYSAVKKFVDVFSCFDTIPA